MQSMAQNQKYLRHPSSHLVILSRVCRSGGVLAHASWLHAHPVGGVGRGRGRALGALTVVLHRLAGVRTPSSDHARPTLLPREALERGRVR